MYVHVESMAVEKCRFLFLVTLTFDLDQGRGLWVMAIHGRQRIFECTAKRRVGTLLIASTQGPS